MNTPVFSFSVDNRSISVCRRASSTYASTSSLCSGIVSLSTRGCSGASTTNVTPKIVSIRVVKVVRVVWSRPYSDMSNSMSTPSLRPIQLVCMMLIFSGQSIFEWSRSSSAYWVTLNSHWSRSRLETSEEHRSHRPSMTCSLARTVLQDGHQLAGAWAR